MHPDELLFLPALLSRGLMVNPPASPADSLSEAQRRVSIHEPSMFACATDVQGVHVGISVHGFLEVKCHLRYSGCSTEAASQILGPAETPVVKFLFDLLTSKLLRLKAEMRSSHEVEKCCSCPGDSSVHEFVQARACEASSQCRERHGCSKHCARSKH